MKRVWIASGRQESRWRLNWMTMIILLISKRNENAFSLRNLSENSQSVVLLD